MSNRFTFFLFLVIVLIAFTLAAQGQIQVPTSVAGKPKLHFGLPSQGFDFTIFNVTKTDTVGFEQMIVPEGIKEGEKWIITATKIGPVVPPKPPMITTVDNVHPDLKYSSGWQQAANQPWTANYYLKTASYAVVKDQTLSFSFTGTGFEIWAERRSNHGEFAITVDSEAGVLVDTYSSSTASPVTPEKVFERLGLPDGTHQVLIRLTGVKNPAAATAAIPANDKTDISVSIDKIVFFKPSL